MADFGLAWYASDKSTPIAFEGDFKMYLSMSGITGYGGAKLRGDIQAFLDAITDAAVRDRIAACPRICYDALNRRFDDLRDRIWMPRQFEVYGPGEGDGVANAEYAVSNRFPVFTSNYSRKAYAATDLTRGVYWTLASQSAHDTTRFRMVGAAGSSVYGGANVAYAIRPCYTIA